MAQVKNWKSGCADEVWKIIICARDIKTADDLIQDLIYILTSSGSDIKAGYLEIKEMSGKQILDGINSYKESRIKAVQNALEKSIGK